MPSTVRRACQGVCTWMWAVVLPFAGHPTVQAAAVHPPVSASTPTSRHPAPSLTFWVLSDLHIRGTNDRGQAYVNVLAERNLSVALQDIHQLTPAYAALILNGDLTDTGMPQDYAELHRLLAKLPHPARTLCAIGNHEFYAAFRTKTGRLSVATFPNGQTDQRCIERFTQNTGVPHVYYDRWVAGYHFIILGTEASRMTNPRYYDNAVLSSQQLAWLQSQLQASPADRPVFVFLHQPIPHTVAGSSKETIVQPEALKQILYAHPNVVLFSGHTHLTLKNQPLTMYHHRIVMFNDASVYMPLLPNHQPAGTSEGLCVEVYAGTLVVRERDFRHHAWLGQYRLSLDSPAQPGR
ncbi:MAG: metallophosphoesterase [Alicyclobacillus sp.]|nr:metallophosphoesterase [Alicyclobacillus sp.]